MFHNPTFGAPPYLLASLSSSSPRIPSGFSVEPSNVHMLILQVRHQRFLKVPIKYVGNEAEFRAPNAWETIVDAQEPYSKPREPRLYFDAEVRHLQAVMQHSVLTRNQEAYLFRKMNYLKFVANEVRKTLSTQGVEPHKIGRIDQLLNQAHGIRTRLIEANLRFVMKVGSKQVAGGVAECISIGSAGLIAAVDTFDYRVGTKFCTYAIKPIRWSFNAYHQHRSQVREKFQNSMQHQEKFEPEDTSGPAAVSEDEARTNLYLARLEKSLPLLRERHRYIIVRRFGLDGAPPETLREIGERFKICRQRVNQIEREALQELSKHIVLEGDE